MHSVKFIQPLQIVRAISLAFAATLTLSLFTAQALASASISSNRISCSFSPHLSCADSQSGKTLWENPRYSDPEVFTLGESQLFISHSTTSSSFTLQTGELVWQISSGSNAHYFYPVVDGESVYLTRSDGILEKRRTDSGEIIWSRSLAEGWVYPPLIQQDQLITGGQNRTIWLLDRRTGQTRDTITLQQELVAPLFQAGNVFVASTFDGRLSAYRLNPQTASAEPLWQAQLDAPAFSYLSDSRHLVAADMGGKLSSLDPETGDLQWRQTVHQNALFWSVLYRQSLISVTNSGTFSILDINSGQLQQQMQFKHQYVQAPIVRGEDLALYDASGAVQHLTPQDLSLNIR